MHTLNYYTIHHIYSLSMITRGTYFLRELAEVLYSQSHFTSRIVFNRPSEQ